LARKERILLKYLASAICFIIGVLLIIDARRSDLVEEAGPAQALSKTKKALETNKAPDLKKSKSFFSSETIKPLAGVLCGTLLESCTAKIAFTSEDCDEKQSRVEVNELLDKPLKNIHCQDIYERIDKACSSGCRLDASRSVILPGDVQFFFDDESEDSRGLVILWCSFRFLV